MTVLFKEGVPAQDTPIRSVEIRDNFGSLYDKLKTLEPRATAPESTQILVNGGPVYFRASTSVLYNSQGEPISGSQRLIIFQTSIIDLATANGSRTIKNPDGSLAKETVIGGISPFTEAGFFREILITLNNQGRLTFVEGATTSTGLSRPFDIAFDDSEIPICLVMVQQFGLLGQSGQLAPIRQINITDIRPIITTAFQNNITGASLEQNVLDNRLRIDAMERSFLSSEMLKVQIPSIEQLTLDSTKTTNTKLEILSGSAYINGKLVKYPGGMVDIKTNLTTPLPIDRFAAACVALDQSGSIVLYHGSVAESDSEPPGVKLPAAVRDVDDNFKAPANSVPLAIVYYRMSNQEDVPGTGLTLQVKPMVSDIFLDPLFDSDGNVTGGERLVYAFDIIEIIAPNEFKVLLPVGVSETALFLAGQKVDLFDDNSRPIRRIVAGGGAFDPITRTKAVIVDEPFVNDVTFATTFRGISLRRHPKARIVSEKPGLVIEDVRPFVTEL